MPVPEKKRQIAYYEDLLREYGPDYRALDWKDPAAQDRRFYALVQIIYFCSPVPRPSILDVGCGLGDLFGFLKRHPEIFPDGFEYSGWDIVPAFVDAARKKYPEGRFEVVDILEGALFQQADFVISCGTLTIRTAPDRAVHDRYVEEMMQAMWRLARKGVAVDFLSEFYLDSFPDTSWHEERYTYFKPAWVIEKGAALTHRLLVRHDYEGAEFSLYLLHADL